ncbi:GM16160 [Drosophila sechellia]|uniref:GM16160 n=2 Tax=Drosophila sechellia TaxID=7238 RepID=B4IIJ4_DROSE|nr:GM16160 [Drosophila sechellia]
MSAFTCTQFLNLNLKDISSMSTTVTLDAACFGRQDLNLFIESLETISRLEKERHERRQLRREQRLQQARITEIANERCSSPTPRAEEAVDEPLLYLEAKCIPYAVSGHIFAQGDNTPCPEYNMCDDEAYGSASYSARSSVTYCSCVGISNLDIDSGESEGKRKPFVHASSQAKPKNRYSSTRSRIINLVLKRNRAKPALIEHLQRQGHCDTLSSENISHQFPRLTTSQKRSAEHSFLDKALRYLTL